MRLPLELEAFRAPSIPVPSAWVTTRPEEIYRESAAELSRRSLWHFLRFGWHVIEPGTPLEEHWHLKALCDHAQWVLEGWLKRRSSDPRKRLVGRRVPRNILANAPPGVIKSRIFSVYAHAWMWLHAPEWRVTALSVNPRVAQRDAGYAFDLLTSEWYRGWFKPNWEIRGDKSAVSSFENTAGGWRQSLGWGAKTVGQRGDALIIDDPNDPEEAYSDTKRKAVNSKWKRSHANRINDQRTSLRLAIQQRVHYDDWSATFLRETTGSICHLKLPTLFAPEKRCRTEMPVGTDSAGAPIGWCDPRVDAGEVIHPARFTPDVVAFEQRLGPFRFAAQHQQEPDDTSGSMFQRSWFRWWKPDGVGSGGQRPEGCRQSDECPAIALPLDLDWWATTTDASFKATEDGSRVSVQVWVGKGPDRFLIDCVTKPMGLIETVATILMLRERYNSRAEGNWRHYIEDKANGTAAVEQLQREITGVIAVEPKGGKESRGMATQPIVYGGNVYLPEGAEFLELSVDGGEGWLPEVSRFPNGDKDDQVDAFTQVMVEMQVAHDYARTLMLSTL